MRNLISKLILLVTVLFAVSMSLDVIASVTIEGKLLEKGTKKPLAGFNVFVLPSKLKAVTDDQGRFIFRDLPEGELSWVVNGSGYRKLTQMDSLQSSEAHLTRVLYLEKDSYQIYETTVVDRRSKRDASSKTLQREEFLSVPGANGDPVRAVQNLPGINRTASFSPQVVIQGSGPQDTRFTLDGHEIPLVFHFGGLTSVVIPEAVDRVDYLSAGYGPEFGRANGGQIGLWSRSPKRDRTHGLAFADLFNAGGLIEGAIGEDGGYLISARQSYFGTVLRAAFKNNKDFNLTVAPSYADVNAIIEKKLSPIDDFRIFAVASHDSLEFLLPQPVGSDPALRGNFKTSTAFYRLIPQLTHRHSSDTVSRWSVGYGRNWIFFDTSENYFRLTVDQLTTRDEVEHHLTQNWKTFLGLDALYGIFQISLKVPSVTNEGGVVNPISTGAIRESSLQGNYGVLGLYERNEIRLPGSSWTWMPNARLDYFSLTREWLISPRPAVKVELENQLQLRSAGGVYYQPPEAQQVDSLFGNPDVQAPRAWHLTAGAEKDFRGGQTQGWVVSGDGFYKFLDRLVIPSSAFVTRDSVRVPENFNNSGKGRAFGLQTQVKYDQSPWSASVVYTLSRSTRWSPSQSESVYGFDQTHLFGMIGSVELGHQWKLSSRLRYSTGNPKTPIVGGIFDADNDVYMPVRGSFYSERLDPFYQLDFRVDKKWIYNTWILSLYLDIQNVTSRKNPEQFNYSYDYSQKEVVSGLPILPTLGIKGEF